MNSISIFSDLLFCVRNTGDYLLQLPLDTRSQGFWDGDQFKSQADIESHNRLTSLLSYHFPGTFILSEESDERSFNLGDYIVIDPIDGTRSYVEGFPGWVVQASLVRAGKPFCSVIYAPALKLTYHAILGQGAFLNNQRIIPNQSRLLNSIVDNYPLPRGISSYLFDQLPLGEYIESGSISLKLCYVASSKSDLFVKDMKPRDWDIIPPMLLLSELGYFLTDLDFQPHQLNESSLSHNGIIACRSLHQANAIRPHIEAYLNQ